MTRRFDYGTAEKVPLALLTRAAFGDDAGMRTALRIGMPKKLITDVFSRVPVDTRIDIIGSSEGFDQRLHGRPG